MSTTTITYIGGPTAILEYAGLRMVTDPTFDSPQSYSDPDETTLVKTAGPGILRSDLGHIDATVRERKGEEFRAGSYLRVPVLAGHTRDETKLFPQLFASRVNAIENSLSRTFLHPKELIEFMNLHHDLLFWLQRHYNELTVLGGVKHLAKIFILDRDTFDIFYITFHGNSFS